jgi:hypothetical protein
LTPTILARVLVTVEYLGPAQLSLMARTTNHIDESDDRRHLKYAVSRVQLAPVVFQDLGFAPKH